jgi:hypothetical protein
MAQELGGSQIGALLETVPGIASVLRSPVADALVNMIRVGAGIGEFRLEDTRELIQYAVRRGLIGSEEGERLTADIEEATRRRAKPSVKAAPKAHRPATAKALHKPAKRAAVKKSKAGKKRRA